MHWGWWILVLLVVFGVGMFVMWAIDKWVLICGGHEYVCQCNGDTRGGRRCEFCSGHGRHDGMGCICDADYQGVNCSCVKPLSQDPRDKKCKPCSGQGDFVDGRCQCYPGYTGEFCEIRQP